MQNKILATTILIFLLCGLASGQGTWTQKANFPGIARYIATGFSIGNKGYIGTGASGTYEQDFWEYDPSTDTWTQKSNFGGTARKVAIGFSIGNKGYIGTGDDSITGYLQDFWEYDPSLNSWTQKANFPANPRTAATGFSIGTKGYIGLGEDGANVYQDFWEYDQSTNTWTQKANFGGTPRFGAIGFSIGNKGYIGTGWDGFQTKDFWEWNQSTNMWTQIDSALERSYAVGFSIGTHGYIGTGVEWSACQQDFWEYEQGTNTWTQKANFGGVARYGAVGFSIGNRGYILTGYYDGNNTLQNDLWEYTPDWVGINETNIKNSISIFPNPFISKTIIKTDKIFKDATLAVYNSFGHQVKEIKNISGQTIKINRDYLPSGIYFIRLTEDNKNIATEKLIIID